MKHLPNALTIARIIAAPISLYLLLRYDSFGAWAAATVLFILAAITDYYDGKLARDLEARSRLGQFLDPLADKILVLGAFIALLFIDPVAAWIPWWAVALVLFRDVAVTGLRTYEESKGRVLKTSKGAKAKTAWQLTFLISTLVFLTFTQLGTLDASLVPVSDFFLMVLDSPFTLVFVLVTVAVTVYTGVQYFVQGETETDFPVKE
ncbi:CDP-diacylglycerol--glycerol-3-phosphate 3-phosphatidyltransferase [soil metagenome]